jgi:hypothetical protein
VKFNNSYRLFPELTSKRWHPGKHISNVESYLLKFDEKDINKGKFMSFEGADNNNIPSGYTYLGQFIAHDLSFSQNIFFKNLPQEKEGLIKPTPYLDLDSLYGGGPLRSPYFYDQNTNLGFTHFYFDARKHFIGDRLTYIFDLPRKSMGNFIEMALIPDLRNDENVILSQLHLAFQLFHNTIANKLLKQIKDTIIRLDELNIYFFNNPIIKENRTSFIRHENFNNAPESISIYDFNEKVKSDYEKLCKLIRILEPMKTYMGKKVATALKRYPWDGFELLHLNLLKDEVKSSNQNDLERFFQEILKGNKTYSQISSEVSSAVKNYLDQKSSVESKLIRINGYVKKFEGQIYLKTFFEARRIMRWHYHWIILNDYLPKIVGKKIVLKLLKNQKLDDQREPFEKVNNLGNIKKINDVPVEFSIAAFRFGHSMIRDDYKINDSSSSSKLLSIKRTNQRFNDILDWRKLFTRKDGNDKDVNMSMKIDPSISSHMVNDLDVNHSNLGIVTRNLLRSWQFQLPSGQVIAEYLGLTIIRKDILEKEKFLKLIKNYKRLSNQELKDYENKKYKTKKEFLSRLKDSFPHNKGRISRLYR